MTFPRGALRCYLDGNALTIVKDNFENIQESPVVFVELSLSQLARIRLLQADNLKDKGG